MYCPTFATTAQLLSESPVNINSHKFYLFTDGTCDQRIKVVARPLQMVYDAQTVIEIVKVFKPPTESTALST